MSDILERILAGEIISTDRQIIASIGFLSFETHAFCEPKSNCNAREAVSFAEKVITYCEVEVRIVANCDLLRIKVGKIDAAIDAHDRIYELCCFADNLCKNISGIDFQRLLRSRLRRMI